MNVEERKVQKTGAATYTISLPKSWVVRNSIKSGDKLSIIEDKDGHLLLSINSAEKEPYSLSINIDELSDSELARKILATYLDGGQKIKLSSKKGISSEKREAILGQIKRIIGFEITEESEKAIHIQDFFSSEYLSITKSIKRASMISQFMFRDCAKVTPTDQKALESIHKWEEEVDRLRFLVKRELGLAVSNSFKIRSLGLTPADCIGYSELMDNIEGISDHIVVIAEQRADISNIPEAAEKKMDDFMKSVIELYELAFKAAISKDFKIANQLIDRKKEYLSMKKDIDSQIIHLEKEKMLSLNVISNNIYSIVGHCTSIAENAIDQSAQQDEPLIA